MNGALTRELPKLPDDAPAVISPKMRELLTLLCFRKNTAGKTGALFCFCTNRQFNLQAKTITDFLDKGYTKNVIIAGGAANYNDIVGPVMTEATEVFSRLDTGKYPDVKFILEKESKNTHENVTFALKKFDFSAVKHITFSSQSFAAGRSYLTLRKFLPDHSIGQNSFDIFLPQQSSFLSSTTWHLTEPGIKHVWGEFTRICKYGLRGDIAFDEVRQIVQAIQAIS
jgi:hypothetical protein